MTAVIPEAGIGGRSPRTGDDLVPAVGMTGISPSPGSEVGGAGAGRGKDWRARPWSGAFRYRWLAASALQGRPGGRVGSVAALSATGVNTEGGRAGRGLGLGAAEAREFGLALRRGVVGRGVPGVQGIISEAMKG